MTVCPRPGRDSDRRRPGQVRSHARSTGPLPSSCYGNLPESLPVLELPVVLGIAVLHGRRGRGHGDGRHDEELEHGLFSVVSQICLDAD